MLSWSGSNIENNIIIMFTWIDVNPFDVFMEYPHEVFHGVFLILSNHMMCFMECF